jgi:hypothetical protein
MAITPTGRRFDISVFAKNHRWVVVSPSHGMETLTFLKVESDKTRVIMCHFDITHVLIVAYHSDGRDHVKVQYSDSYLAYKDNQASGYSQLRSWLREA